MGCGCGGKPSSRNIIRNGGGGTTTDNSSDYSLPSNYTDIMDAQPSEWGPIFWNALHTIASKLGLSKNRQFDIDQGMLFRHLLANIPNILPCQQCQQHARDYMAANPVPEFEAYRNTSLNLVAQTYLFNFHNAVRTRLGQTITMNTMDDCMTFYKTESITTVKMNLMNKYGLYGVNQRLISIDTWKSFMNTFDRLRLLSS